MSFSFVDVYAIFRQLGLRHLIVTDEHNLVKGIITRKNLLGHAIEAKLKARTKREESEATMLTAVTSDTETRELVSDSDIPK